MLDRSSPAPRSSRRAASTARWSRSTARTIKLEIADGVVVKVARRAIGAVIPPEVEEEESPRRSSRARRGRRAGGRGPAADATDAEAAPEPRAKLPALFTPDERPALLSHPARPDPRGTRRAWRCSRSRDRPVHKKPTLGLDLQGGLEVVLKAVPPKGKQLTSSDVDRSVGIMRNRIDKLGVERAGDPQAGHEPDRDPARRRAATRRRPPRSSARPPSSSSTTSRPTSSRPSIDAPGLPGRRRRASTTLLAGQRRRQGARRARTTSSTDDRSWSSARSTRRSRLLEALRRQACPKGCKVFAVPSKTTVITCGPPAVVCPGVNTDARRPTSYYLFKYTRTTSARPGDDGQRPEALGHAGRLRPDDGPADRADAVHRQGRQEVPRDHADRGPARPPPLEPGSGTKAPQHFAIVLDGQIQSYPQIDFSQYPDGIDAATARRSPGIGSIGEAKDIALVLQTGALPVNFDADRAHRRLGDARQGLAAPGHEGGADRPARSSRSSCSSSTASSASSP